MSRSLSGVLLKGIGVVVVLMLVLSVVSTILSVLLGIVATIVSLVVTVTVLLVVALAAFGLVSLLGDDDSSDPTDRRVPDSRSGMRNVEQSTGWRKWLPQGNGHSGDAAERDPEDRLRERYVAGEINEAEFERKMGLLLGSDDTEKRLDERNTREYDTYGRDSDRLWER
ncbi:SHOCT domain-containing protein [Halostella pelagica]|uniref:SHOCT domain-containing protein n=1 Tax=Halostella pelagica TaxID=2583824 RepID=UPI0010809A6B|nr:SHOCT domain-containing protein [Halostella pelagica]